MNTFATLLLAFPFYLAVKGRLSTYIALAKPSNASSTGTQASASNATTSTASTASVSSSDLSNVVSIFKNVGEVAALT